MATINGGTAGYALALNPTTLSAGAYLTNTTTAHGGDAVYGSNVAAWQFVNLGTISTSSGHGVRLTDGGTVDNFGTIASAASNAVVLVGSVAGTVANYGLIESSSTAKATIYAAAGGVITNAGTATISGARTAISFNDTAGTTISFGRVDNAGTIISTGITNGSGVYFGQGGSLTNEANSLIVAYRNAVNDAGAALTLTNFGTIQNTGTTAAVYSKAGGLVTNTAGLIESEQRNGVSFGGTSGAAGAVVNQGTILADGTTSGSGVYLGQGGIVSNAHGGVIAAYVTGINIKNVAGTIANSGMISSSAPLSGTAGAAIYLGDGGLVTNLAGGTLTAQRAAISIAKLGIDTNYGTIVNSGLIIGSTGVLIATTGATGLNTIINYGTITGTGTSGIAIQLGNDEDRVVLHAGSQLNGSIGNFLPGDTIDLPNLAFAAGGSATLAGNTLTIVETGGTVAVSLYPNQSLPGAFFQLTPDGSGGTLVTDKLATRDFDRDGTSDILWRDASGDVAIWLMNGGTVRSTGIVGFADNSWHIIGTGAITADGRSDILWENDSGTVAGWAMDGTTITGTGIGGTVDPTNWNAVGTGDFNGDGITDLLWRDVAGDVAIWQGSANGSIVSSNVVGSADLTWQIRGIGDFFGSGTSDILWQNTVSGAVDIWQVNNLSVAGSVQVGFADNSWHIRGTGDFNGDGKSDILWQDNAGDVAIWEMNGASAISTAVVGFADATTWSVADIGDYNGDGKSDILWRDTAGDTALWETNGTSVIGTSFVGFADAGTWTVAPPNNTGDTTPPGGAPAAGFAFADISTAPSGATAGAPPPPAGGGSVLLPLAASPAADPALPHTPLSG